MAGEEGRLNMDREKAGCKESRSLSVWLGSKGNNHVKRVEPLGEVAGVGEFACQLRVDV